jgi:hypothetical protein
MLENTENTVREQAKIDNEPIDLEIQVTKASPLVRVALDFHAMRAGMTVSAYCARAILWSLECDEQTDQTFPSF